MPNINRMQIKDGQVCYNIKQSLYKLDGYICDKWSLQTNQVETICQHIAIDFWEMANSVANIIFEWDSPSVPIIFAVGRTDGWLAIDNGVIDKKDIYNIRVMAFFDVIEGMLKPEWWTEAIDSYIEDLI